jgi:hypothetical protein
VNAKESFDVTYIREEETIISKFFDEVIDYGVDLSKNAAVICVETDEAIILYEQAGIDGRGYKPPAFKAGV